MPRGREVREGRARRTGTVPAGAPAAAQPEAAPSRASLLPAAGAHPCPSLELLKGCVHVWDDARGHGPQGPRVPTSFHGAADGSLLTSLCQLPTQGCAGPRPGPASAHRAGAGPRSHWPGVLDRALAPWAGFWSPCIRPLELSWPGLVAALALLQWAPGAPSCSPPASRLSSHGGTALRAAPLQAQQPPLAPCHRVPCISALLWVRAAQTVGELTAQAQIQPQMTGLGKGAAGALPKFPHCGQTPRAQGRQQ